MTMSVAEQRTRCSTPRARTGCQTCRKRHIKCDESKPTCLKCSQVGWKCDGYAPGKPNGRPAANKNAAIVTASLDAACSITSYSIPFRIPGSQKDRRIMHYFCVQGCFEIAGYLESSFWTKTVLQESHHEPAVLKALIALSSIHLGYYTATTNADMVVKGEALAQHGKALRALQKRLEKPGPQAVKTSLICCVLFFLFEAALGNSQVAMAHLQSGLSLLSSLDHAQKDGKIENLRMIIPIFEQLDLQATLFNDERMPYLELAPEENLDVLLRADNFTRVEDAYRSFISLQHGLSRFLVANARHKSSAKGQIPATVLEKKAQFVHRFKLWKFKCDNNLNILQSGNHTTRGVRALLIQWHVSLMLLEADYPTNEAVFGASPNPRAQEIIALARLVLMPSEIKSASTEPVTTPPRNFSSDTGIVAPLFILAMKCSDEYIRSQAADLLSTSHRREGLYNSESMAAIINQLQRTRQERRASSQESILQEMHGLSLEKSFARDLDKITGGMDKLSDFIEPQTDSTHNTPTKSTGSKQ